eukprot:TRINITY_DN3798_c0_g1_i1.p1 TRINITY_DN3798_c0_g1~~TRINITY_DN3798_c0_g1_i1.p1  ORF type:complete len:360 (+),score=9.43 TRINITY_DN3798_c0_g1_i1:47-1126(+)
MQIPAAVYGLEFKVRCISAVVGDVDQHSFLVGTLNPKANSNQLHLLRYSEEENKISCEAIWNHSSEIWHIAPCPSKMHKDWFFTVWNKEKGPTGATLFSKDGGGNVELKQLLTLDMPCSRVLWDPAGIVDTILVIDESGLSVSKLEANCTAHKVAGKIPMSPASKMPTGAWDPNHPDVAVITNDCGILKCDLRAKNIQDQVDDAHTQRVSDVQFNANKMYRLASSGDDGYVKLWDTRKLNLPLMMIEAHDHWVSSLQFNPSHDQLVLTSSTDSMVKLWDFSGLESGTMNDDQTWAPDAKECLIKQLNEYEDSVYSVSWSGKNPWVFASVSYNGKVLVYQVPEERKVKILLQNDELYDAP